MKITGIVCLILFLSFSSTLVWGQIENREKRDAMMEEVILEAGDSFVTEAASNRLTDSERKEIEEDIRKLNKIGPHGEGLEEFKGYRHPNDLADEIARKWSKTGTLAAPLLTESLKDGNGLFFLSAVSNYFESLGKAAIPIVTEAMDEAYRSKNSTFKVNLLSLYFLNYIIEDQAVISVLERTLKDKDLNVREATFQVFAKADKKRLDNPSVISLLKEAVKDKENGSIRHVALFRLGHCRGFMQDASSVDFLIEALGDKHSSVREQAAGMLGDMRVNSAVPALIEALNDRSIMVRRLAIEALRRIRDPRSTSALIKQLRSFPVLASDALAAAGDPTAISALEKLASRIKVTPLTRLQYKIGHLIFPMGNPNPDRDVEEIKNAAIGAIYSIKRRYGIDQE